MNNATSGIMLAAWVNRFITTRSKLHEIQQFEKNICYFRDLPAGKKAGPVLCDLVLLMYKKRSRWLATLLGTLYQLADFVVCTVDAQRTSRGPKNRTYDSTMFCVA